MKIVVTGGAGFIGSEMCHQLLNSGHQVAVLDSLTYASRMKSLEPILKDIEFVQLDIRNNLELNRFFATEFFDAIINFAAETHVDNSISNPQIFAETNVIGTVNLLEQARKLDLRFLQVSTDEVYGSISEGTFNEEDPLNPSSPYSSSKASAELILSSYVKTFGVNALGVRCSNNYGFRQHPEKLIPSFISRLRVGKKVPIYGLGKNVREWIHVKDSTSGILQVLESGRTGEFYNISSGFFLSNLELTYKLLNLFDMDESMIEFVEDRAGHDFRYAISSKKIQGELGWKPTIEFEVGLKSTVEWYLNNPDYLQSHAGGVN
jgi:dTDP-glucose 4,6-dehydratase